MNRTSLKTSLISAVMLLAFSAALPNAHAASLTLNAVQNFGTIDPAKVTDYTQYMAAVNLYDGLVGIAPDGALKPGIATKWTASADGKTFTFTIKSGVPFHSGGTVSAADVVYSMKRALAINQGPSFLWTDILKPENVTSPAAGQVKFVLNKTFSPFLNTLPLLFVLNSKALASHEATGKFGSNGDYGQAWLNNHDEGSGPYTLGKLIDGSQLTLNRFPKYFQGFPKGAYDTVNVIINTNDATVQTLAKTGQLQMTSQFQATETYDALAKQPDWKVVKTLTNSVFYLKLNTQRPPFDDVHMRRAVAAAIDYATIQSSIYPGAAAKGVLAPGSAVSNPNIPVLKQDMAKAKAEMAQSKYAGKPINITLMYVADTPFEQKVGLLVQSNLAPLGITVTLQPAPWTRITQAATKVETTPEIAEIFFQPTYPSANSVFYTQYASDAPHTWASMSWLKDTQVDNMIKQALATTDPAKQKTLYQSLQQRLYDLMPDIPLVVQEQQLGFRKDVQGYQYYPVQSFDFNFRNYYQK